MVPVKLFCIILTRYVVDVVVVFNVPPRAKVI